MKKSFGQTVRELKRGVNKKVGKAPGIEGKVFDATSNDPWGPDGSLLADIAMATRNHHEYKTIMEVIWKRLNDTGKNWRHVYKALTVLDYLIAHGSERVIDELREHVHQISTLSNFRYIDSGGRDQGINVRKKSQSLVALVNDRERILEVRQKAAANRDKFRNTSMGGMYGSGSGGYDSRYDYDWYGDSKIQDGDRYGRDIEDRYSKDGYYRGRNRNIDDYHYGRSRSCNRQCDFDEDDASRRARGARADYLSPDGRPLERKFSEQLIGAPPSYEAAVSEALSPVHSERDAETSVAAVPKVLPSTDNNPNQAASDFDNSASSPNQKVEALDSFGPCNSFSAAPTPALPTAVKTASTSVEVGLIGALSDSLAIVPNTPETLAALTDENATHGAIATSAANQPASNDGNQGLDDPFGDGPFKALPSPDDAPADQQSSASMPSLPPTMNQNANIPQQTSVKSETVADFDFEDLFSAYTCSAPNISSIQHPPTNSMFLPQEVSPPNREIDILADILPPSGPAADVAASHAASFSAPMSQSASLDATYGQSAQPGIYSQLAQSSGANLYSQPKQPSANPFSQSAHPSANLYGQPRQPSSNAYGQSVQPGAYPYGQTVQPNSNPYGQPAQQETNPFAQSMQPGSNSMHGNFSLQTVSMSAQIPGSAAHCSNGSLIFQLGPDTPVNTRIAAQPQIQTGPAAQFNTGNFLSPLGSVVPVASLSAHQTTISGGSFSPGTNTSMAPQMTPSSSTGALAIVSQPSKDRFESKSAVWADTLSRGLINLNISGSEANTLADIGVDFDAINRKEKRMEKHAPSAVTSTVTMGKAMGSGSGIGRTGASFLRPPTNPMVGSGMGMGMSGGPVGGMLMGMGGGIGMGGYGSMNRPPMGINPSMGMDIGMRQGSPNMPPQKGMSGSYNPVMDSGGNPQQPYGSVESQFPYQTK